MAARDGRIGNRIRTNPVAGMLDRRFKLTERGTTVRIEVVAGVATGICLLDPGPTGEDALAQGLGVQRGRLGVGDELGQ